MSAPAISGLLGPRIKVPWAVPRTHVTRFAINASSKETLQQMECLGMIYSLWRACWRLMNDDDDDDDDAQDGYIL